MKVAPVSQLQFIGLQWAKLARSILCFGVCLTFHDELTRTKFQNVGYKNGLIAFVALVGMPNYIYKYVLTWKENCTK